jgi:hypothetical protein
MEAYTGAYKNKDIDGLLFVFSFDICGFGSGSSTKNAITKKRSDPR